MTTIESDGIRVEAENEAAALKALKAARRKRSAEQAILAERRERATREAQARGYRLLCSHLSGEDRGYDVNPHIPSVTIRPVRPGTFAMSVVDVESSGEIDVFCLGVDAVVESRNGRPMAVWLIPEFGSGPSVPYCVAVVDGEVGLVPMPACIRPEMFQ